MIVFSCVECGQSLQALESNAGKKARCKCGAVSPIPLASSMGSNAPSDSAWAPPASPAYATADGNPVDYQAERFPASSAAKFDEMDLPATPVPSSAAYGAPAAAPVAAAPATTGPDLTAVLWGVGLMILSVVWFFGALAAGRIFFYPPILFIIGLFKVITGLFRK